MVSPSHFTLSRIPAAENELWLLHTGPSMKAFDGARAVSWVTVALHEGPDELVVLDFETSERYRGHKIGMRLLQHVASQYAQQAKWVILDDCSGANPPRNVYYKFGFQIGSFRGRWVHWYESSEIQGPERRIRLLDLVSARI